MSLTSPLSAQINYDVHNVSDPLVRINSDQSGTNTNDIGTVFERGALTNVALIWDESADEFVLISTTEDGTTSGNVTIAGYSDLQVATLNTSSLELSSTAVTATATQLNILDGATISTAELNTLTGLTANTSDLNTLNGITSTTTELNIVDGDTAATATTVVDADRLVLNDDGTMVQVTADDLNTYLASKVATLTNKTLTSPTINSPTITDFTATGTFTVTSTDSGSAAAPELEIYRDSASPADGDYIGQIKFSGESDTGATRNYAKITGKIKDATNGTEDGIIEIAHIKAGSQNINVRSTSTEFKIMNGTDFDIESHDAASTGLRLNNTLVTATAAELNYSDGVTSNIQTQLDSKQDLFTGTTGAVTIPVGTTVQRPGSPTAGMMRFNSDDSRFEGYNGTSWVPIDTLYS
jgi:hypothetical protein